MTRHDAEDDWVSRFASEVIEASERRAPGHPVVVASGLSPSGPIHLGNLREVMTPHLVADEVRRRGVPCVHILSWDDYDRFRRVPAGIDPSWSEHIGKPLSSVPAPEGSGHANWAEHFKAPMLEAARLLGIEFVGISQTERYTSGAYVEPVLHAMRLRKQIDAVLDRHRTKVRTTPASQDRQGKLTESELAAALAAREGSGAADEDDGSEAGEYYPYKPYCAVCWRDTTTITAYDDETTMLCYICDCGHQETIDLSTDHRGKLVWKVDWPMRWAYEGVIFEPSGVDHQSPGSSFVVGGELVKEVFAGEQPIGPMYAFVGISGMAKMSSSKGSVPTPLDALNIMEPEVLRWLYARRKPQQSFTIAFDQEIYRLYDEWDALGRKVLDGASTASQALTYDRAVNPGAGALRRTPLVLPYRTLASVADITTGDPAQMLRILGEFDPEDHPLKSLDEVRPRLDCAQAWVMTEMSPDDRTSVRHEPDYQLLATLTSEQRESLAILLGRLDRFWSLDGLTTLVYAVPKLQAGLEMEAQPTPEIKVAQRQFFALLYQLLVGRDTGPRLPTLLLAIGSQRVRALLGE
jgi:lysyl-tRNA synthetase class 1